MTNTRNTPIEALDRTAGGEGIERDLQVLEDATVSLITVVPRRGA